MSTTIRQRFSTAAVYRRVMRLHSAVPFHVFRGGRAFPTWHYFFEVTRRCNLRCAMCQYRDWFDRHPASELKEQELTLAEWKKLVDQTGPLSLITFTGGEPWVRPDFADLLEYASQKRRTHLITNGLLLNEERAALCVDLAPKRLGGRGFSFLGTSIDGTREAHDAIRGREGAFEETLANVRRVVELRDRLGKACPRVHATAVIQSANLETLPQLPQALKAAGVDILNLTMEIRFPGMEGIGDIDPDTLCTHELDLPHINPPRLEKALTLTQGAANEAGIELRLPDMPRRQIIRYHYGGLDLDLFTCRGPWTNLYIGAAGEAYPCVLTKLGNVREHTLRDLWNGEKMRAFRRRLREGPFCICQGCCHLEYSGPRVVRRAPGGRGHRGDAASCMRGETRP